MKLRQAQMKKMSFSNNMSLYQFKTNRLKKKGYKVY